MSTDSNTPELPRLEADDDADEGHVAFNSADSVACLCKQRCSRRGCVGCVWLLLIGISIACFVIALIASSRKPTRLADPLYPIGELETGIYWFGRDNYRRKFVAGVDNPYFNSSARKTVIFTHGWAVESAATRARETFNFRSNDPKNGLDVNTANAWLDDGWNVGVFYWTQLAAEPLVTNAEAKIWSAHSPVGMRWRKVDLSYSDVGSPNVTVADLFAAVYVESLSLLTPPLEGDFEIRLAGHSLGNQVVLRTAWILAQEVADGRLPLWLRPARVALLDPYYSYGGKAYLGGQTVSQQAFEIANYLKDYMALENYKTSMTTSFPFGNPNAPLQALCVLTYRDPQYAGALDFQNKHIAAPNLYFLQYKDENVPLQDAAGRHATGVAPSSRMPTADLLTLQRDFPHNAFQQVRGLSTQETGDDVFQVFVPDNADLRSNLVQTAAHAACLLLVLAVIVHCLLDHSRQTQPQRKAVLVTQSAHMWVALSTGVILATVYLVPFVQFISWNTNMYPRTAVVTVYAIIWVVRPVVFVRFGHRVGMGNNVVFVSRMDTVNAPALWQYKKGVPLDQSICQRIGFWIGHLILLWVMGAPVVVLLSAPVTAPLDGVDAIGWILMIAGIVVESTADLQVMKAVKRQQQPPSSRGPPPSFGLWAWTQHPQLCGELMAWWGLYLTASRGWAGAAFQPTYPLVAVICPIIVTVGIVVYRAARLARARHDHFQRRPFRSFEHPFLPDLDFQGHAASAADDDDDTDDRKVTVDHAETQDAGAAGAAGAAAVAAAEAARIHLGGGGTRPHSHTRSDSHQLVVQRDAERKARAAACRYMEATPSLLPMPTRLHVSLMKQKRACCKNVTLFHAVLALSSTLILLVIAQRIEASFWN